MSSLHPRAREDEKKVPPRKRNLPDSKTDEMRAAFRMLDLNDDGRVQPDELAQMLARMGVPMQVAELRELLRRAHPSGEVGEEEFLLWMSSLQEDQLVTEEDDDVTQDLVAAFKVFDRDCDGFITREELRGALDLMGEASSDTVLNDLLPPSGKISQEDFVRILL